MGDFMKRLYVFLVSLCVFLPLTVLAYEQPEYQDSDYSWKYLKTKKDGAKNYVSETPWSRFRTFKSEMILDHPFEILVEVLLDVNGFQEWLPDCMLSKHLETKGDRMDGNFVVHVKWNSIFPIRNRDFVIKVVTNMDWMDQDDLVVELISIDDSPEPVLKGTKRLTHFYSRYHFTRIDRNKTYVTYSMLVDPDLPLFPRWMVEIQTASIAYKTLKGLNERAEDPRFLKQARIDLM